MLFLLIPAFIIGFAAVMTLISSHVVTVAVDDEDGNKVIMSFDEYRQRYICPAAYTLTKREREVEEKYKA